MTSLNYKSAKTLDNQLRRRTSFTYFDSKVISPEQEGSNFVNKKEDKIFGTTCNTTPVKEKKIYSLAIYMSTSSRTNSIV
jgi:hypothetical protein